MERSLYLAVEGPIGVGKTTLVRSLAERLQARLVLEAFEENPFLAGFYEDRDRYAFQTQIFFLMSRFKQQQELTQSDLFSPTTLSDYHLLKDRIFASLTLSPEEMALYEHVYSALEDTILQPDLVIYLHARQEVLLSRISKRGRSYEKDFDPEYLHSLSTSYLDFFNHYQATPLLPIDTSDVNYAEDKDAMNSLIDEIYKRIKPSS